MLDKATKNRGGDFASWGPVLLALVAVVAAIALTCGTRTSTIHNDFNVLSEDKVFTTTVSYANGASASGQRIQLLKAPDGSPVTNAATSSPVIAPAKTPNRTRAYPDTSASFTFTNAALGQGVLSVSAAQIPDYTEVVIIYNTIVGTIPVKLAGTSEITSTSLTETKTVIKSNVFK